ncbi:MULTISPECIES: hypothetical protein [Bacillus]|uniref:hypothetical protein n=1 Tax=Bacillus TaxID=1386 RepID=UPI0012DCD3CA|nr:MULTISPECIES: hypothetical protein [Bacillus]
MWVCNSHMKEIIALMDTPHISKASYQIKCSACDNRAIAKVYFAHKPFRLQKNQKELVK